MNTLADPLSPLPATPEARRFDKPWHAEAFGLAIAAHKADLFVWKEWVQAFAGNSRSATAGSNEQDEIYYEDWLGTLEDLLMSRGVVEAPEVQRRTEEWRQAYLNTPHGEPVVLEAEKTSERTCMAPSKTHSHDHHHGTSRPAPVFVSPGTTK